jgi:sugar phosphate isomerase/epimerase
LGKWVRSCHAKDVTLATRPHIHMDEIRPGLGNLNYRVFLEELSKLDPDTPLMLEHLATEQEYKLAAEHIRKVATQAGVSFKS